MTKQLRAPRSGPVVVIDPDEIVRAGEVEGAMGPCEVHPARNWFDLRRAWERYGRNRAWTSPRLVVLICDPGVQSPADLPFDIEQSSAPCRVRVPAPAAVRPAILALDAEASDLAIGRIATNESLASYAVLTAAAGLPAGPLTAPSEQLRAALRLLDRAQPDPINALARATFSDSLALAVMGGPPRLEVLQDAWETWLVDPSGSEWAAHFEECRAELIDLFLTGRLRPAPLAGAIVPPWASIGVEQVSPRQRVEALLGAVPEMPATLDDWIRSAQWWGEVRSDLAMVNPTDDQLDARAWDWWLTIDNRFVEWLRANYGKELTRTWANWPVSLDKVQPFLAKRQPEAGRLLLVVLDGMGFTQWTRLRELGSLKIVQSGGVLAMLPTLTEVSRQAIAAGGLPIQFAESLRSTSKEAQRWAAAWIDAGVSTAWVRVDGARPDELTAVPFGTTDVIGLVLSATDELMHSAELLGDIGLHAGLDAWVRTGVLQEALRRAAEHGYETWLTADHGNLAVEPAKEPREGAFVERAGTRARRYGSKALRDSAVADGIVWDELPGYPRNEAERLLFAPGRTGWGTSRLSHGGLSLDEVIVPLVQIELAS